MKKYFTIAIILAAILTQAQGTFSLIEINPLHGSSPLTLTSDSAKTFYGAGKLSGFVPLGGKLYFSAQGSPGNDELWVTDGTQNGTALVKEINALHGAGIGNLVLVNNHVLFMASDNDSTWDLWSSDGTSAGTLKIETLNQPTNTALGYDNFSWIGNRILFCTKEKLLISDGTAPGTDSLLAIANYSQGFGYCELNGQSYFVLPEQTGDYDIWRTDGTVGGTQEVINLADPSYHISDAGEVVSYNGKIYLSATDSGQAGADLFAFDGNINGQLSRITIAQNGNSRPHAFNLYNNDLYFIASSGISENVYRISDSDTVPVALIPNAGFTGLSNLSFANNMVYCMDSVNNEIHAVELSGFTSSTLHLAGYRFASFYDKNKPVLLFANQHIFFEAYDSTNNNQLFLESDFTIAGTRPIAPAGANTTHLFNCYLGNKITDVFDLMMWGSKMILPANFNDAGRELWLFDPSGVNDVKEADNENLFVVFPNPAGNALTVKTNPCSNCEQQIEIADLTGRVVLQQGLSSESTTLQLSFLAAGNYMVTLLENGKTTGTKKLVITR